MEEKRIYVVVAGTIQTPRTVIQPPGRQIAQACHVVSKLRHAMPDREVVEATFINHLKNGKNEVRHCISPFEAITTIILQARDSAELQHVQLLACKKKLQVTAFFDTNPEYGDVGQKTAIAFIATPSQTHLICDYLPLWGAK